MTSDFQSARFGNYLLISRIGRGGMAEVFKARVGGVQGFEKTVCVKRILRQHCEDRHFVDMFVNEAKISARLSHPNIVQVFELGEVSGEYFMAMEFVSGCDLYRVMKTHGSTPLPALVATYIAREMCRALAHAHEHLGDGGKVTPIVHRDVSPQNVMVSYDGIVKLVDFGIAKALEVAASEETRAGVMKGKIAYMAPEQMEGAKASPLTDIFAVGVTLFEVLTGRRLFRGESDIDTMIKVRTMDVPEVTQLNPEVGLELSRILAMALAKDPAKRYQRASHMARDLDQARVGFNDDDMKAFMAKLFPQREEVAVESPRFATMVAGGDPIGATLVAPQVPVIAPVLAVAAPVIPAAVAASAAGGGVTFAQHPEDKRVARIHRKVSGQPSAIDAAELGRLHEWLRATFSGRPLRLLVVLECAGVQLDDDALMERLGPADLAQGFEIAKAGYVVADKGLREQLGRLFKASYTWDKFKVFPLEKPAMWQLKD